jgi:hypothetical protein
MAGIERGGGVDSEAVFGMGEEKEDEKCAQACSRCRLVVPAAGSGSERCTQAGQVGGRVQIAATGRERATAHRSAK